MKKKKKLKKINKMAWKATRDLLKSGVEVKDVFGHLDDEKISNRPTKMQNISID